jgi:hypothetical protein
MVQALTPIQPPKSWRISLLVAEALAKGEDVADFDGGEEVDQHGDRNLWR